MTTQTDTSLELGDIQAAALMPRPHPYAGAYLALRIDDRQRGTGAAAAADPPARPGLLVRPRPAGLAGGGTQLRRAARRSACRRSRWPASRPSSSRAWPLARTYIGDVGENAPEHWEAPLGSKDVHVVVAALARDTALMETLVMLARARRARPARCHPDLAAGRARATGRARAVRLQGQHQPAGRRGHRHPRQQPARGAAEGRRVRPGLRGRDRRRAADAAAGGAGPQRHLRGLPQAAPAGGGLPPLPARRTPRTTPSRSWLAAKLVGRWPSGAPLALAPDKDDPELGADPERNNAFLYGDDPRGLKCPVGVARPADERARRGHHRPGPAAPDDPARHQLRPVAAPRRAGGRRRRPRPDVRLRRRAPGPAVRVRPAAVGQRRQVHRRARRAGPADRRPGRRAVHHPQAVRSAAACSGLPNFVVNRGGEYCFMPGLRALRWLADLDT